MKEFIFSDLGLNLKKKNIDELMLFFLTKFFLR